MRNTFELGKYLRSNTNPKIDLKNMKKLEDPEIINIKEIENCTKITKYLFFIKSHTEKYFVSLILNEEEIKKIENREFTTIKLNKKYNKIYYDVELDV
ncbi:uncharacterized protein VNE69_02255 [Vairimorpha necatrix]|uniref:Uncharacterized protein n=1 Tax=Vairimorpha necatrix TaxID=6039 RepID=A0AAX4J9U6_9MICR